MSHYEGGTTHCILTPLGIYSTGTNSRSLSPTATIQLFAFRRGRSEAGHSVWRTPDAGVCVGSATRRLSILILPSTAEKTVPPFLSKQANTPSPEFVSDPQK